MAISAILFLIRNGQPAGNFAYFSILSTFWPSLGWPAYCSLSSHLIPSLRAFTWLIRTQTKGLPIDAPFKSFTINIFPFELAGFLALSNQCTFHFRKPSTSGGRKPSRWWKHPPGASPPKSTGPFQWGEPGSPTHQSLEGAMFGWPWVLKDSGKLLPLTEEHHKHLTVSVIYSYLFQHFHLMFYHTTFQIFISKWSSSGFPFSFLAGHEEVEGGSGAGKVCSTPGARGTPGAGVALAGTPAGRLVDLMSAEVHGVDELAPPPSGVPSPSAEDWWSPSPWELAKKRAHHAPISTMSVAPKEAGATLQEVLLPSGPSEAIAAPLRSSLLPGAAEGTSGPLPYPSTGTSHQVLQGSELPGLCQNVHMWAVGKACLQLDSVVSHCTQEHLGVCQVCPQCGMSYSDPSKFHLQGRGTHDLLFY